MKSAHPPKPLVLFILILVSAAFLGGILRLIPRAHAAEIPAANPAGQSFASGLVILDANLTPTQSPVNTPTPIPASADTSGMITLAVVIVATIILGTSLGVRSLSPRKKPVQK